MWIDVRRSVNIGDLNEQALMELKVTDIDTHQVDVTVKGDDFGHDSLHFFHGGNWRWPFLSLGFGDMRAVPVLFRDEMKAELDACMADAYWPETSR
jgi:hypothetical protein